MDIEWLEAAFHRTRKDGAPGVDGQTWAKYAENLEENLQSLLDREVRHVPGTAGAARVHSQGGLDNGDSSHWNPDPGKV